MTTAVVFVIPIRLRPEANMATPNSRLAAVIRSRGHRSQHEAGRIHTVAALLRSRVSAADLLPVEVTLTRVSTGRLDDDNLAGACKYVRDGIAEALGIDDGASIVRWRYAQVKGARGTHGLQVRIARRSSGPPAEVTTDVKLRRRAPPDEVA